MSEIDGPKTADFLRGVYKGLKEFDALGRGPEGAQRAKAVHEAARKIDKDAILTREAIDQLNLEPGVRSALIWQLLRDRYPQEVDSQLRSAETLAGVFQSMLDLEDEDQLHEDAEGELSAVPDFIQAFVDRLHTLDAMNSETGSDELEGSNKLELSEVIDRESPLELTVGYDDEENNDTLEIQLVDSKWQFTWQEADTKGALQDWDIDGLKKLRDVLEPLSAEGAQDPLLALHRQELESEEGGVFPELIAWLRTTVDEKEKARRDHLAKIDAVLREHVGNYRVGEAPQEAINKAGDAMFGEGGQ